MPTTPTRSLFPFLTSDGRRNQPRVFGSGVLLEAGGQHFLLSAAHVLDQSGDLILPAGIEAPGPTIRIMTEAPSGDRKLDRLDVGFAMLPAAVASQLMAMGRAFIGPADLDPDDVMAEGKKYSFVGYPGTRARTSVAAKVVSAKPIEFALNPIAPERLARFGWTPQVHLGGAFERKRMALPDGTRANAPEPLGMSGGGVWVRGAGGAYKLVGIGIEWDAENGMLIGTRLGLLVAMIAKRCPEIAPHLRTCRYLNVTLEE